MTGFLTSKRLGADAIYFSPVFESDTHGYNTRDYTKIDTRLGTNKDFANVCYNLHNEGIKVVLDRPYHLLPSAPACQRFASCRHSVSDLAPVFFRWCMLSTSTSWVSPV